MPATGPLCHPKSTPYARKGDRTACRHTASRRLTQDPMAFEQIKCSPQSVDNSVRICRANRLTKVIACTKETACLNVCESQGAWEAIAFRMLRALEPCIPCLQNKWSRGVALTVRVDVLAVCTVLIIAYTEIAIEILRLQSMALSAKSMAWICRCFRSIPRPCGKGLLMKHHTLSQTK